VSGRARLIVVLVLFVMGVAIAFALMPARPPVKGGRRVPQRIIALAPSHVELVFALGCGRRMVGVGDHCVHPPKALDLPRCGGTFDPNYEQMLALRPDLLVVQGRAEKADAFCRRYGVPILRLEIEDLESLYAGTRELGQALDVEDAAEQLVAQIQSELDALRRRVAGEPRPTVFLCLGRRAGSLRTLFSAGGPTFLTEMLDIAGGENVFADVATRYPTVSKEDLVARGPDWILEIQAGATLSDAVRRQLAADWASLPSLPAVRNDRIRVLTDDHLLLPGPRLPQIAARFADVLHPAREAPDGQ